MVPRSKLEHSISKITKSVTNARYINMLVFSMLLTPDERYVIKAG
jgi:hypothetical protein